MDNLVFEIIQLATPVSALILIWQLWIMNKQHKNDHERSRRHTVIELQKMWMDCLDKKTRYSRLFIRYMDKEACRNFWNEEPFKVPVKSKKTLMHLCDGGTDLVEKDGEILIQGENLITLRTYVVCYLNLLEVIFTSWKNSVGDKDMIEEEFGLNVTRNDQDYPLDMIIDESPFYPSIKAYTFYLKSRKAKKTIKHKPELG